MMEENNRKGPGIFYAVVGVATLVVAIIGATFAYFSASVDARGNENLTGGTLDVSGTALSATVDKVVFKGTVSPENSLVPAYFGGTGEGESFTLNVTDPAKLGLTNVQKMVADKCENATEKYTGCHVYRIQVSSKSSLDAADVLVDLSTSGVTDSSQWGYAVFKGTEVREENEEKLTTSLAANSLVGNPAAIGSNVNVDIHDGGLTVADGQTEATAEYFLLVYVNDTNKEQNADGASNVTGNYSGTVTFQAAGGTVRASFGA